MAPQYLLVPGDPVEMVPGRGPQFPSVTVVNTSGAELGRVSVEVVLPGGRGLGWGGAITGNYYLMSGESHRMYAGKLSRDGRALTFEEVMLDSPSGTTTFFVEALATSGVPVGTTALAFYVGDQFSYSGPIVVPAEFALMYFSMGPGASSVLLEQGGAPGYPGVIMWNTGPDPVGELTVSVKLPPDTTLVWGQSADPPRPDYQLTVLRSDADPAVLVYDGSLSWDGRTLTFTGVDPGLPHYGARSSMYVTVSARRDAPLVYTALTFFVEGHTFLSSNGVQVTQKPVYEVRPGPLVMLPWGESHIGYPGVEVRNTGAASPFQVRTVTATLPPGNGVRFVPEAGADYQVTVQEQGTDPRHYHATLSADARTLTAENVRFHTPAHGGLAALWVPVAIAENSTRGFTAVTFEVGTRSSDPTPIRVQ
ncbi:hypothetical protein ACFYN3_28265 [Streptomyces lavendulae]|uniref:hypothetical protein n=2 Tax=Streptomyces lavendulae TaxID=1914 RepID=UPI0036736D29